ncbi:MAG: efflux RND transporter periplasmic adaptor subunit [Alphaproteobacteria bacterium]|nr:efflux RND transporter periplasmic adaptor subunit [Alphaproteobacteria bacterium]
MILENLNKKKVIVLVVVLGAVFGGYKLFFGGSKSLTLKPEFFEFAKISKQDIHSSVSATGTINPVNVVSVGAQVSGIVDKIYVDYNDDVKTGQLLAQIDKSLLIEDINSTEAKMAQAKAKFDLAKLDKDRTEALFNEGYIAKLELDQAVTDLASAEADYIAAKANNERSKRNIEYAEIKSPVSGVVISRDVEEGQTIASSFSAPTLFTIAEDLTKMQIEASISEADIGNIKKGQNVDFTVDAFPVETFHGKVDQVRLNPTTEQNVVIYNVIIKIDNKDGKLLPGMTAFVDVDTLRKNDVLSVENYVLQFKPDEALQSYIIYPENKSLQANETFIYTFKKGDKDMKAVKVVKGITNGVITEISAPELKDGDMIISDFLYEGNLKAKKSKKSSHFAVGKRRGPMM